jgi:hypothetical protein
MVIWYIFPRFGMLYHEKSGTPVARRPGGLRLLPASLHLKGLSYKAKRFFSLARDKKVFFFAFSEKMTKGLQKLA